MVKKLLSIVLLFVPIIAICDNSNLIAKMMAVVETSEYRTAYNPSFMSCQELVDLKYKNFVKRESPVKGHIHREYFFKQAAFLFPDGEKPTCGEDVLPIAWIKNTTKINDYATTKCRGSCNFRYAPNIYTTKLNDTTIRHDAGRIEGNQRIFLHEFIETYEYSNLLARSYVEEKRPNYRYWTNNHYWYRFWYTFFLDGKKYYIHEDNITLDE